jgi:YfiH family protein
LTDSGFQIVTRNKLTLMESTALAQLPWLVHGFSLRYADCGLAADTPPRPRVKEFNLGFTPNASRSEVERNRRRFVRTLGSSISPATVHQIHSAAVWQIRRKSDAEGCPPDAPGAASVLEYRPAGSRLPDASPVQAERSGDALITSEPGVLLTIRTADCLPVLIADKRLRAIAAIHAGWRGALERVIEKAVGEMQRAFASRPQDLVAALGPAIGRCCYEVGDEVIDAFRGQFVESESFFSKPVEDPEAEPQRSELRYKLLFHTQAPPGHRREPHGLHLDLAAVARAQLLAADLDASSIQESNFCTACRPDLFFSHRRDGGQAGRMMAAIGIRC